MSHSSRKTENPKMFGHERLRRLLLLVPLVTKQQGISVNDLASHLGLSRETLLEELDLLAMVGRPPFQPDDYIDVYVENDCVYVDLDQRLNAPPRLTAAEAAALAASAALLKPAASDTLARALQKLEQVIPAAAKARFEEIGRKLNLEVDAPSGMAPLTQAIVEHREVEFEYVSIGKGHGEHRLVRPHELFSHRGQWYLSAYCCARNDDRLFRLDRIRDVQLTDTVFLPKEGARAQLSGKGQQEVEVCFSPKVARYQAEVFKHNAVARPDGSLEVKISTDSTRWLVQWVLSFGGEARVVSPAWAVEAVVQAAQHVLAQ